MLWRCAFATSSRPAPLAGAPSSSNRRPGDRCSSRLPIRLASPSLAGWNVDLVMVANGCSPAAFGPVGTFPLVSILAWSNWWVDLIGLEPSGYGTHSLRRTKVCLLYKKTGNLRACQLLLGHTKLESTVRYLGVELDDALLMSESLEL